MSLSSPSAFGSIPDGVRAEQTLVGGKRASSSSVAPNQPFAPSALSRSANETSEAQEAAPSTETLESSRYEIREEIGRGGCGVVLRAFDRQMQRDVVIKRVFATDEPSQETISRFLNEARITGRLEHPGIVPVHEIGQSDTDGAPFYVMKWLHGKTLAVVIADYLETKRGTDKQRKFHELLTRFHQVCQTLAYAHRFKIIHRDLKPANVMVGQFGETIVLDWGLAKDLSHKNELPDSQFAPVGDEILVSTPPRDRGRNGSSRQKRGTARRISSSQSAAQLTQLGTVMGTAAYMSPEQARGESRSVDCRSDVFSLGVILYEILAGVSPFRSSSVQTTLELVARAEFRQLRKMNRQVPRALEAISNRALQLDPENRYHDASELATDIEDYLAGNSVSAYREPWWCRIDRFATNNITLVRSAFLAMFAIAMLSILSAASIDRSRKAEVVARKHAEQETREKISAFDRERIAHDKSLQQLKAARKSTDAWLIELSGDLQYYPGLGSIRNQLLSKANEYYQANADSANNSEFELIEAARANIRLGDIARLTKDFELAHTHYSNALELLPSIQSNANNELFMEASLQSANALLGQALCCLDNGDTLEGGLAKAAESAIVSQELLAQNPEDKDVRKTWLRSQQATARLLAKQNKFVDAAELLEKPVAIAELLDKQTGDPSSFHLLTSLQSDRARMLESAHLVGPAAEAFQQLISLYSNRLRLNEPRPDWLEARANAYLKLGKCNTSLLRPQAAILDFEASEEDMQTAWSMLYDDPYFRESFAVSSANVGKALVEVGDTQQAEEKLRTAISRLQDVIQHDGTSLDRIARMANLFVSLACVLEGQEKSVAEFSKLQKDADTLLHHLALRSDSNSQWLAVRAQWSLLGAGHELRSKEWSNTIAFIDRQLESLQAESANGSDPRPDIILAQAELVSIRGLCHWELGGHDASRADFQFAMDQRMGCVESNDTSTALKAGVSILESLVESPLASQDDRKAALPLAKKLTRIANKHPTAWHWLAMAAWENDDMDSAKDALQQAKRLRSRIAIEDEMLECLLNQGNSGFEAKPISIREWNNKAVHRSLHQKFLMKQVGAPEHLPN